MSVCRGVGERSVVAAVLLPPAVISGVAWLVDSQLQLCLCCARKRLGNIREVLPVFAQGEAAARTLTFLRPGGLCVREPAVNVLAVG